MRFTIYDILSNLIPGIIFIGVITVLYDIDKSKITLVSTLASSYAIGFILNSLSSWIEPLLFWTWGGNPSDKLLNGRGIWKIHLYNSDRIKNLLIQESNNPEASNNELFNIAMTYIRSNQERNRIYDFNAAYAFSRSLFITLLILYILGLFEFYNNVYFLVAGFLIILIVWYRTKQRDYYYVKEVLNNFLLLKKE